MEDDDVGSTEYWRNIKQAKQEKRADNRESSAEYLAQRGIPFVSKNGGRILLLKARIASSTSGRAGQVAQPLRQEWFRCAQSGGVYWSAF